MGEEKQPAVYIVVSGRNGTIYEGVTGRLRGRVAEHRAGTGGGFAGRYGCKVLVWYQLLGTMEDAIARENQIKAGSRRAKLYLIGGMNPDCRDLYEEI